MEPLGFLQPNLSEPASKLREYGLVKKVEGGEIIIPPFLYLLL